MTTTEALPSNEPFCNAMPIGPPLCVPTALIQFNSIQFYLYSAKTIQLSQGALQSPVPGPPYSEHNGDRGKKKTPCYRNQEETLSRTTAHSNITVTHLYIINVYTCNKDTLNSVFIILCI